MGHWLTVKSAEQARMMALANQDPLAKLLRHSGFGSQYAAARYQLMLTTHGITTNMSKRGSCWATPVLRVSSERSSVNSSTSGTSRPVKTKNEISSISFRDSTIGRVGAQHLAVTPQPSTTQGRLMKTYP